MLEILVNKRARKFLDSVNPHDKVKLIEKMRLLISGFENKDIEILKQLDIKNLKGEWKDYKRLRQGDFRIIFKIEADNLIIEEIDYRDSIY